MKARNRAVYELYALSEETVILSLDIDGSGYDPGMVGVLTSVFSDAENCTHVTFDASATDHDRYNKSIAQKRYLDERWNKSLTTFDVGYYRPTETLSLGDSLSPVFDITSDEIHIISSFMQDSNRDIGFTELLEVVTSVDKGNDACLVLSSIGGEQDRFVIPPLTLGRLQRDGNSLQMVSLDEGWNLQLKFSHLTAHELMNGHCGYYLNEDDFATGKVMNIDFRTAANITKFVHVQRLIDEISETLSRN